ncbi:MAG: hypothetical protein MJK13_03445 [Pseudomonadales bacterium]|nr:hypothetical protein [Pseudomonadales bacterium]
MNFLIIGFVVLSLIGSVMWVMPTKRDKFLASLRMDAKRLGFQVQLVRLVYPREKGLVEPRTLSTVVYRLLRGKIDQQHHHNWNSWRIAKCETNACEGLLPGWGWAIGERTMNEQQLTIVNEIIAAIPEGVQALESTPIHVSAFWNERQEKDMLLIEQQLKTMIQQKI